MGGVGSRHVTWGLCGWGLARVACVTLGQGGGQEQLAGAGGSALAALPLPHPGFLLQLYILSQGQCIFKGVVTNLIPYLKGLGLHCPTYHNPADFSECPHPSRGWRGPNPVPKPWQLPKGDACALPVRCWLAQHLSGVLSSSTVIEVASGEYGDLNPVLFRAVQNGMCTMAEKKSSPDKADSSCPTCGTVSGGQRSLLGQQGPCGVTLSHVPVLLQDVDHIESHTFATSTSTQFCILFKRTFICILRDTVRAGEAGPGLEAGLCWRLAETRS